MAEINQDNSSMSAFESPAAFEFLRERLEAKLEDPTFIDRVQAELDRHAQSNQYLGPDPTTGVEIPLLRGMLNADGTVAIKGEAAEQLKALIREAMEEWAKRWGLHDA